MIILGNLNQILLALRCLLFYTMEHLFGAKEKKTVSVNRTVTNISGIDIKSSQRSQFKITTETCVNTWWYDYISINGVPNCPNFIQEFKNICI